MPVSICSPRRSKANGIYPATIPGAKSKKRKDFSAVMFDSTALVPVDLLEMKVEMSHRIVKQLFERHELIKVFIPFCWIIHTAPPFIFLDRIDFSSQGKINAIINVCNSLAGKHLSLPTSAKCIEPVEGTCECVYQPCKPFVRALRQPAPYAHHRYKYIDHD